MSLRLGLSTLIALPVVLAVFSDLVFDYFFAIRQIIFVLPPLAMTSASGLARLWRTGKRAAISALVVVLALNIVYAVRWFTKPGENRSAAAHEVARYTDAGSCVIALPPESVIYYEFFAPRLKGRNCHSALTGSVGVVLTISPYQVNRSSQSDLQARLKAAGFVLARREQSRPEIRLYVRR